MFGLAIRPVILPPRAWLEKSNPFWLVLGPYLRPESVTFNDCLTFLGGCAIVAAVLTLVAMLTLRRAACRTP